jgi:hypothetical protein
MKILISYNEKGSQGIRMSFMRRKDCNIDNSGRKDYWNRFRISPVYE